MPGDRFSELERQVLLDLLRRGIAESLSIQRRDGSTGHKVPKDTAPAADSFCARLRSIRRWIITREVAALLHCHTETIYRRVKSEGLPAHRDGRLLKYYPPEIADWIERRAAGMPRPRESRL